MRLPDDVSLPCPFAPFAGLASLPAESALQVINAAPFERRLSQRYDQTRCAHADRIPALTKEGGLIVRSARGEWGLRDVTRRSGIAGDRGDVCASHSTLPDPRPAHRGHTANSIGYRRRPHVASSDFRMGSIESATLCCRGLSGSACRLRRPVLFPQPAGWG